mmetsp:Transcript_57455/g.100653  ORF Transcript_57455/g.100653 Transcript_57455/m.100653 type:complete len:652 (-) Transcript_57455:127-2082(-)
MFLYDMAVRFFSMLLGSVHGAAFLLGATVYVSYALLLTLRLRSKSPSTDAPARRKESESDHQSSSKRRFPIFCAIGVGLSVLVLVVILVWTPAIDEEGSCPAEDEGSLFNLVPPTPQTVELPESTKLPTDQTLLPVRNHQLGNASAHAGPRRAGFWKFAWRGPLARPSEEPNPPATPMMLLAQAKGALADQESGSGAEARHLLEACASSWTAGQAVPKMAELQAQLECHTKLVQMGMTTKEASNAQLNRAKQVLSAMTEDTSIRTAAQAEWARLTHETFQQNCKAVSDDLQSSRRNKAAGTAERRPLFALRSLRRLHAALRETLDASAAAMAAFTQEADLREFQKAKSADVTCALRTVQEGRSLALALPRNSALVRRALQCSPDMLVDVEAFVVQEAEKDSDAGTVFGLGLYWSDIGTAGPRGGAPPFFSTRPRVSSSWASDWSRDLRGYHAPADVVRAEEYLLQGLKASGETDVAERGGAHALRLYQHAKLLALKHHDAAAEWRYRAAAQLASKYRRTKLAAHAMARLSYFLSLRGRLREALEASDDALSRGVDPLAQYLQASLRCKLGELRTEKDVCAAEQQLGDVAGQLPSEALERQREAAHADLAWWRAVAAGGIHVCFNARDAAQLLVCIFCSLIFTQQGEGEASA